jgi:hypothetical protein
MSPTGFLLMAFVVLAQPMGLEIELPGSFDTVVAGEDLYFIVTVENTSEKAAISFVVKDPAGHAISGGNGTADDEMIGHVIIPADTPEGRYRLQVDAHAGGSHSSDGVDFTISGQETLDHLIRKASLFDIIVTVPDQYMKVSAGEEMLASMKLINVGSSGRVDVFVDYWMTDPIGETVQSKRETVAVETQANFVRSFTVPKDAASGIYRIHARITYSDGKVAESDQSFEVVGGQSVLKLVVPIALAAACAALVGTAIVSMPRIRRWRLHSRVSDIVRRRLKK